LFERIQFEEEHHLRNMISRQGGALICHYRVGPETRVGRVRVEILPDQTQCQISMEDLSTENFLRQTLDVLNQAVVLLAENEVVLYFNSAAARLFPDLVVGVEAVAALQTETFGAPWWEMGSSARQNRNVQVNGRPFRAVCTNTQLPGQDMLITVLSLSEI
jgi:PAS domain-containing protein